MDFVKKYAVPAAVVLAAGVLLFVFRTLPASKLWKEYSVLYVPVETSAELVLSELQRQGCRDVISYYNQKDNLQSEILPVKTASAKRYLDARNVYFFDESRRMMIYYIPDKYAKNAAKAVSVLTDEYSVDAGLDAAAAFPLVPPVICVLTALVLLCFSRHKTVFFCAGLFPVLFVFSMPFYTNAAAVCILLYAFFLCQKVWKRRGALRYVLKTPYITVLFFVSAAVSFFASVLSGLLFFLSLAASASILSVASTHAEQREQTYRFRPVLIKPARMMNVLNVSSVKKAFVCEAAVFALFVFYAAGADAFSVSNSDGLSFPAPARYNTGNGIPTLDDYVAAAWNVLTLPYKSLNIRSSDIPGENECVAFREFENTADGVRTAGETVYCFDDDFKNEVIRSIDSFDYPALEKLMKMQEAGFSVGYAAGHGEKFSRASVILMLSMIIIPCGLTIFYLTGRKKYGDSI